MNNRVCKAIANNRLSKKAAGEVTETYGALKDVTYGALMASLALTGAVGAMAGGLMSKATSPTDVDLDNARKEYKSNSLDAAISELSVKLQNERNSAAAQPGTRTMQKAMRLV